MFNNNFSISALRICGIVSRDYYWVSHPVQIKFQERIIDLEKPHVSELNAPRMKRG